MNVNVVEQDVAKCTDQKADVPALGREIDRPCLSPRRSDDGRNQDCGSRHEMKRSDHHALDDVVCDGLDPMAGERERGWGAKLITVSIDAAA